MGIGDGSTTTPAVASSTPAVISDGAELADSQQNRGGTAIRLNPIKLRQMKERRHAIEDEVSRVEGEIANYEKALANFTSAEKTMRTSELLGARRTDLEALMSEWEQVSQTVEANR